MEGDVEQGDGDVVTLAGARAGDERHQDRLGEDVAGGDVHGFYLASYANVRFRRSMRDKGVAVDDDIAQRLQAFRDGFDGTQAYDPANRRNLDLLDSLGLTRWLADQFLVTGPLDTVLERVRALIDAGARNLVVPQMLPDPIATTSRLAPVIAAFA
jgi:hypothetical protein